MAAELRSRRQHRRRSTITLAATLMFASLHASQPAAAAGPPSPANSTMPAHILVVGTSNGAADPHGSFTVTVRDVDNLPMQGVTVTFDVSNTDVGFTVVQPIVTYISCTQVSAVTDQDGKAFFIAVGGVQPQTGSWHSLSNGTLTAGTTLLGSVSVAALDLDGVGGNTLNDTHMWLGGFFAGAPSPLVMDYDGNGILTANDLSLSLSHVLDFQSSDPQENCGAEPSGTVYAQGKIEIKVSPDCQTGAATSFCSGTRTDLVFKVTSPVLLTNVTSMLVDIDVIGSTNAPLADFWRFEAGGCHSNGLQLILPSSTQENCYTGSSLFTDPGDASTVDATGTTVTTYPGPAGLPNRSRIRLGLVAYTRYVGPGNSSPPDIPECTYGYGGAPAFFGANVAFALRIRNNTPCGGCVTSPVMFKLNSITFTTIQPNDWGYGASPKDCLGFSPQVRGAGAMAGIPGRQSARGAAQPSTIVILPDGSGDHILTSDGSTTDVDPTTGPTSALWLASAAPNPTPAGTMLAFSLPGSQHARLEIVDVAGRMVRVIADGPLDAGEHRLGWDGTDASGAKARAGVYYCRLLTGGERRSTTIVLTR